MIIDKTPNIIGHALYALLILLKFQVDQNIISNISCFETYQTIGVPILDDMICTLKGPLGTESICTGDSGSPLMVRAGRDFGIALLSNEPLFFTWVIFFFRTSK